MMTRLSLLRLWFICLWLAWAHSEEVNLTDGEHRQVQHDIIAAYELLTLEIYNEAPHRMKALRKELAFLNMRVLVQLPHKRHRRYFHHLEQIDQRLRKLGKDGLFADPIGVEH